MGVVTAAARISIAAALDMAVVFFDYVMVSVDHVKAALFLEKREQPEYIAMYLNNLFQSPIFPQFISVTQFNISVTGLIIIPECCKIQVLVF